MGPHYFGQRGVFHVDTVPSTGESRKQNFLEFTSCALKNYTHILISQKNEKSATL